MPDFSAPMPIRLNTSDTGTVFISYGELDTGMRQSVAGLASALGKGQQIVITGADLTDESLADLRALGVETTRSELREASARYVKPGETAVNVSGDTAKLRQQYGESAKIKRFRLRQATDIWAVRLLLSSGTVIPGFAEEGGIISLIDEALAERFRQHQNSLVIRMSA
ncbi:MAG: hypothetical protein A2Z83_05620 [Omnitrophica bacterium GWA2_52_8]|nr:MAG: hypothetical protein A2Z83_05620 [Omnitrophica bacterium GWA2_52_8]